MKAAIMRLSHLICQFVFFLLIYIQSAFADEPLITVEITAKPITQFSYNAQKQEFGSLRFMGGLSLSAKNKDFGGFSGLSVQKGRLISVSDRGMWLYGKLLYNEKGAPIALRQASLSRMRAEGKRKFLRGERGDAESLIREGNFLYVGFERKDALRRYSLKNNTAIGKPTRLSMPMPLKKVFYNKGLEAITLIKDGRYKGQLLALSEETLDAKGHIRGSLGFGAKAKPLSVKRSDDYAVTDAASLPNGDVIILERKFSLSIGVWMRLRHIKLADIKPNVVLDGDILMEASLAQAIDNMEGLSIEQDKEGRLFLTLISDDNFSFLQRTLLLRFELLDKLSSQYKHNIPMPYFKKDLF